ncbi:MAG TPA: glycosyltransferase family 1 protein [Deltaproteobacteria bacterium]|nr:glycosyltransferase family 1 protein [Deltaproteobacteria bacterium]
MNDKKLVLFFTYSVSLGEWEDVGILERELTLYRRVAPALGRIFFFTYGDRDDERYSAVLSNLTVLVNKWSFSNLLFSFIGPLLHGRKLKGADLFKTNQLYGSWSALIAKLIFRKKLIVRGGYCWTFFLKKRGFGPLVMAVATALEYLAFRFADVIVLPDTITIDHVKKRYGIPAGKIRMIPNYVDTELFRPMDEVKRRRGRICVVANLKPQKNLSSLISAVRGLPVKLVVMGVGELKVGLAEQAEREGVDVEFLGSVPNRDLPREINTSEIFVMPSHYEGNPKALLEAMACGTAVVGTNVPGIRNIIDHEKNGLLCEPTVDGLREAVSRLLCDDPLREKLGRDARAYIMENNSIDVIVDKELAMYKELLEVAC